MVIDMAVLIYFIHHTAVSIQLPQVIASIAADLAEAIKEQGSGDRRPHPETGPTAAELLNRAEAGGGGAVRAGQRLRAVHQAPEPGPAGGRGRRGDQPGAPARPLHRARAPVRDGLAAGGGAAGPAGAGPGAHHRPAPDADPGRVVRHRPAGRDRAPGPFRRGQRHVHGADLHRLARARTCARSWPGGIRRGCTGTRRASSGSSRPSLPTTGWCSGPSRRSGSPAWACRPS